MTVLYIREQGAQVRHQAEQIEVVLRDKESRKSTKLTQMPIREIEQVVVYGNVQISTQAQRLLLDHNIDTILLTRFGRYAGTISKHGSKFAQLRHSQLRMATDLKSVLPVAIGLVQAKTGNQRNLLLQLAEQTPPTVSGQLNQAAQAIDKMRTAAPRAGTLDQTRGYEGKASAFYFGALRLLLAKEWSFSGRAYYPPPDPFNALLSFGYSLLMKDIETVIQRVGLDPYVGCLHALEYGRQSLVLDLMEEFRPLVVDHAMLDLVLRKKLTPADFTFTGRKDRPVEIGSKLIPLVIQAYESRTEDVVYHKSSDSQNKIRRCFELQARIYARVILGDRAKYDGLVA